MFGSHYAGGSLFHTWCVWGDEFQILKFIHDKLPLKQGKWKERFRFSENDIHGSVEFHGGRRITLVAFLIRRVPKKDFEITRIKFVPMLGMNVYEGSPTKYSHGNVVEKVGIGVKLEEGLNWCSDVKDTRRHPID